MNLSREIRLLILEKCFLMIILPIQEINNTKGKHTKSIKGIPASEKIIQWDEMIVSKFKDGKIEEEWIVSELVGKLLLKVSK